MGLWHRAVIASAAAALGACQSAPTADEASPYRRAPTRTQLVRLVAEVEPQLRPRPPPPADDPAWRAPATPFTLVQQRVVGSVSACPHTQDAEARLNNLGGYPLAVWHVDAQGKLTETDPNEWRHPPEGARLRTVFFGLGCSDEEGGVAVVEAHGPEGLVAAELRYGWTGEGPVAGAIEVVWQGCF